MEPEIPPLGDGPEPETPAEKNPAPDYDTTHEERLWGMLAHLLTFVSWFIAPLVLYAVKRDQSRFIAFHAIQAILLRLVWVAVWPLFQFWPEFASYLWTILGAATVVFTVLAAIKAYDGEWYEIPLIGRWARKQAHVDE